MDTTTIANYDNKKSREIIAVIAASLVAGFGINYIIKKLTKSEKENKSESPTTAPQINLFKLPKKGSVHFEYEANAYRLNLEASLMNENDLLDELRFLDSKTCDIQKVPHLVALLSLRSFPKIVSPLLGDSKFRSVYGGEGFIPEESFVDQSSYVISNAIFGPEESFTQVQKYLKAGPRKHIFFSSNEVRACIITCGRVVPGLNVIIREIHNCLYYNYNVQNIYGVRYGFKGVYTHEWKKLKPKKVKNIHHQGGTILGTTKDPFELEKFMSVISEHRINQIYCIGGDGTHSAINDILESISKKKLKIAVAGIMKTIEHDIPIIDKSFGFETTVEEATRAIQSAVVEATGFENGVGLVRLMGRHAGFLAMYASLANRDVNVCLVPEFQFELGGPKGLLEYVRQRVIQKNSCIIVVAEGAGKAIRDADDTLYERHADGSTELKDVGVYLKDKIAKYCKEKGLSIAMKYIDPTYMIRDVAATAFDQQMCSQLAQNAVHGAMAGWTGFTVGNINGKGCYIPLKKLISKRRRIEPTDSDWQKLLTSTGQPSFLNNEDALENVTDSHLVHDVDESD